MITMNAAPGRVLRIGYAGEDKVTKVIFPYDESWLDLGEGAFYIRVLRPGDTEPYNAADLINDSEAMTLTLTATDVELSKEGYGQMQVVYVGAQAIKKSPVYKYCVSKAIDEPVDPPDGSIINEIVRSLEELTDEVGDISTALKEKADAQTVTSLSDIVGKLGAVVLDKADKSYVDEGLAGKASTDIATASANGLMSALDKSRLDGIYDDYTSAFLALGGVS